MALVKNLIHLIYSTKNRHAWIPKEVRNGLYAYQAGIFRQWDSPALKVGAVDDHIHALFSLSKNYALKRVVEEVKKGSSKWMKREGSRFQGFYWQHGYAAFSVSESNVDKTIRYIEHQEEHHRKITFQAELRLLLQRHDMDYEERYLWN